MKKIAGNPYLTKREGKLFINSIPIDTLLDNFETPFMIIVKDRIKDNIKMFLEVFNETFNNFECFYSFKANFLKEVCKTIKDANIGAELVTLPELNRAIDIGFPTKKIIVGGPYLSKELLLKALKNHVKEIIVYNYNDLEKVNKFAAQLNVTQDICLRINSQKYESKLGISINRENSKKLKSILNSCSHINLVTILSHFSTQMNSLNQFKSNLVALINSLKNLEKYNIHIKNINLGGGFPEATVMPKHVLKDIAMNIKKSLDKSGIYYQSVYFEPGRYFVGDAGAYISQIINIFKDEWIFLDVGNHICPKFARCSLRFYNISQLDKAHKYKISIAGIVPTDQDVLAKDYFFTSDPEIEDNVLITNVGAYCLTFSNRFPYKLPNIIFIENKDLRVIFDPDKNHDFSLT